MTLPGAGSTWKPRGRPAGPRAPPRVRRFARDRHAPSRGWSLAARCDTARPHEEARMPSETITRRDDLTPAATPPARDDTPDDVYPQTTMRVRKRNGSHRARRRQQDRPRGQPLLRRASPTSTRCASPPRRSAASTTAPPRASSTSSRSRPPRRSSSRSRSTRGWPRACSPTYIDKEVRDQEIHAFSQSIAAGHRLGLVERPPRRLRRRQRPQAERRHRRRARPRVRVLRPAHPLRPLSAASTRRRGW